MLNSNKKAVTLNLKTDAGKNLLYEMVKQADILIENFAPGVMDRLGRGAKTLQEINPRLIYGSSPGYGKTGTYRNYPEMDLVMQAICDIMSTTGFPDQPPVKAGAALSDFSAGIHLYAAIILSLASNLGMLRARHEAAASRTGNRHGDRRLRGDQRAVRSPLSRYSGGD
jgi:formyl-CoA transferase